MAFIAGEITPNVVTLPSPSLEIVDPLYLMKKSMNDIKLST